MQLTSVARFPVKSCRGEDLDAATVEPWGLAGDRRWMAVDDAGEQVTARELPRMLLITPTTRADGGLRLVAPGTAPLTVDVPVDGPSVAVSVFGAGMTARAATGDAHEWFSDALGRSVRLVHFADPTERTANPRFAGPDAPVSFADAYPLNLATTASVDALNEHIASGPRAGEGPVPVARFRANLVVDGDIPWAEDGWRRIRVGDAVFRVVKGCDRCAIPTTDTETARRFAEPTYTLAQQRRWDGAVWFAMNLVPDTPDTPDTPGAVVRVGDQVEVLESEPAPDGPPR